MAIRDNAIWRRWQSFYLQAKDFSSVAKVSATPTIDSFSANNPVVVELNSLDITGIKMANAGDVLRHVMPLKPDWDYTQDIYARVIYTTGSATAADTVSWKLTYELLAFDAALTGTINDALDTVIPLLDVYGSTTTYLTKATAWGKINKNTIDPLTKKIIELELEMDASTVDLAAEGVYAIGLEVYYLPKLTGDVNKGERTTTQTVAPADA